MHMVENTRGNNQYREHYREHYITGNFTSVSSFFFFNVLSATAWKKSYL